MQYQIADSSIEEGLDFACNLAIDGILDAAKTNPSDAPDLLCTLCRYIRFRYVGELVLALECMSDIGNLLEQDSFRSGQFWAQIHWIAKSMELNASEIKGLNFPIS